MCVQLKFVDIDINTDKFGILLPKNLAFNIVTQVDGSCLNLRLVLQTGIMASQKKAFVSYHHVLYKLETKSLCLSFLTDLEELLKFLSPLKVCKEFLLHYFFFFTAWGMWVKFSVWSNGCWPKGDNSLLWSLGCAVDTAWDVLAIPAASPGCWLKLSLLLAHGPQPFLPSRAVPQPGWPGPCGCRSWPIPALGLTWWHSGILCDISADWFLQPVPLDGSPAFHPWDAIHELPSDLVDLLPYVSVCVYVYDLQRKYLFHYSSAAIELKSGLNPANQNEFPN